MRHDSRSAEAQGWRRWYWTGRWKALRAAHLRVEPLCRHCTKLGRTTAANTVDHVREHKGDPALFWNPTNLQSLCKPHHDAGKQREERAGYSGECDASGWPTDPRHPANART